MTRQLQAILEQSRLAEVIEQVEKGQAVDSRRVLALQALDLARAGELFVLEAMRAEDEADERFANRT